MQPSGFSLAQQFFDSQQLVLPFIPDEKKDHIQYLDPGVYGTEKIEDSLYDLPKYLKGALSDKVHTFVLFGFAGHGISSHAMHYYAVSDHLALFFQKGFGNAQRDVQDEREKVNGVFHSAQFFFDTMNKAVKAGKVPEGKRLFVVISDMHPCGWGWVEGSPGKIPEENWTRTPDFLQAIESIPLP